MQVKPASTSATCTAVQEPPAATTGAQRVWQALWPCAFYFSCAFAMNMLTKLLITGYQWHAIYALGAIQNVFTALSMAVMLGGKYLFRSLSAKTSEPGATVEKPTQNEPRKVALNLNFVIRVMLPLIFFHVGNIICGFAAMRVVNMPMYLVLRRLTTINVLLIEWFVLNKEPSTGIKFALLVSATGSSIAGSTDAKFEPWGYMLAIAQNVCTACSLTFSKETSLPSQVLVLINSTAGAVICLGLAYTLEYDAVVSFPGLYDPQFLRTMLFMCCVCVLYQLSVTLCTIRNSALATSVTGNVKDLFSTVGGYIFFTDATIRAANVFGVVVSLIGSYTFSYLKFQALAYEKPTATVEPAPKPASASTEKLSAELKRE
ncbi:hypothetical protein Poli38472_007444 [Pythium oligandrum]|uniref:Sugar phosphate transporter domain-containing protein n=1 Tax=Pythium oligandrum TaxID=41045 RepID=A0A8K1FQB4_PYTOL|nr:hypothetical protein Poli38472_007444 [Pythium oligandrum]|eukprot:TMW67772.1 hypothetical protein Poli38472_007444 [Pythium oligandrum]